MQRNYGATINWNFNDGNKTKLHLKGSMLLCVESLECFFTDVFLDIKVHVES